MANLVDNGRVKLRATLFNTAAGSCIALGALLLPREKDVGFLGETSKRGAEQRSAFRLFAGVGS
jgi:hypothetical protein